MSNVTSVNESSEVSFSAPVRVCHAGEDLDWLGYKCCCTAIDLPTRVRIVASGEGHVSLFLDTVWELLRERFGITSAPPLLEVSTTAPQGSGLSTSSSLTLALIEACLAHAGHPQINANDLASLGYEAEFRISHGGGMDQLTIALGGTLLLAGQRCGVPKILAKTLWPQIFAIILIDSLDRKETQPHIAKVRQQLATADRSLNEYISIADRCAVQAFEAICSEKLIELKEAMDAAHAAMRDLQGMSTAKLELIREIALGAGHCGIKLTGAGGGGCLCMVVSREKRAQIAKSMRALYCERSVGVQVLTPEVYQSQA